MRAIVAAKSGSRLAVQVFLARHRIPAACRIWQTDLR
jgi:hypothetical protein